MPKRLADCSVKCNGTQLDFNVWPRLGEHNSEACLRKAKKIRPGKSCLIMRARSIDGIGRPVHPPSSFPRVRIIREK